MERNIAHGIDNNQPNFLLQLQPSLVERFALDNITFANRLSTVFNMYIATTQINPAENNQVRYNTYFCHAAPLAASPARSLQLGLLLHPHANFPHSDHMLYSEYLAALPYLDPGYLRLPFVLDCRKSLLADPWSTTQFREHA
jgi:hypothetical protein